MLDAQESNGREAPSKAGNSALLVRRGVHTNRRIDLTLRMDNTELLRQPKAEPLREALLAIPWEYTKHFHRRVKAKRNQPPELLNRLAMSHVALAQMNQSFGLESRANWAYHEAITILEPLAQLQPREASTQALLARCYSELRPAPREFERSQGVRGN
ncbi:hypothetical protein V5E97_05670 [Singulisphaera sp. Ch08]|uniref:Uncharacterized protein n=1 Tax=Singulisphaera sp. Ch08 TaxID=3120278 RepID=A0AAU7CLH8_9BACT